MVSSSSPSSSSWINNSNDNHNNNNINSIRNKKNNDKNSTYPAALTMYFEKCLNKFKELPDHIATHSNYEKLQKELKIRIKKEKSKHTLFTVDWQNEPYPLFCML